MEGNNEPNIEKYSSDRLDHVLNILDEHEQKLHELREIVHTNDLSQPSVDIGKVNLVFDPEVLERTVGKTMYDLLLIINSIHFDLYLYIVLIVLLSNTSHEFMFPLYMCCNIDLRIDIWRFEDQIF